MKERAEYEFWIASSLCSLQTNSTDVLSASPHIHPHTYNPNHSSTRVHSTHLSLHQSPNQTYTFAFTMPCSLLHLDPILLTNPHYSPIHPCLKNLLSRNLFFRGFITDDDLCQTPIIKASLQPRLLQNQSLA